MARQKERSSRQRQAAPRHPLLVYYNLGKRYRSPGILLILIGLLAFLPSLIPDLENDWAELRDLAIVGGVLVVVGLIFWLFARLAMRRAYVQANPDVLVVQTPFRRTPISYRRVKIAQPVQVGQVFPKKELKGMGKPLLRPLLTTTAVELQVKSWPGSQRRLRRMLGTHLFSPRADAWIFIVPDYSALIRQIDTAIQRKIEAERGTASGYEDPFERLKYYQAG
jgi:hypothetical protein